MFGWLRRKTIRDPAPYFHALVTSGDTARTHLATNRTARELIGLAGGLQMICANVVAEAVSGCPLRLYRSGKVTISTKRVKTTKIDDMVQGRYGLKASSWAGSGGNVTEVMDHPVLDLLSRPNDIQTGTQAEYQAVLMSLLTGEMFSMLVGGKQPKQMWPMLPQYTEPFVDNQDELVSGYWYGRDRTEMIPVEPEDCLHYKHLENPHDPFHGYGPLHMCRTSAEILLANDQYDLQFIERGNIPPLFISVDPKVYTTEDKVREVQRSINESTRGTLGKLRAIVTAAGLNVMAPPTNAKELQTAEKLEAHRATVRQAFGVPQSMLELNDANLASSYTGNEQFWGGTIRPILWRRAEFLTEHLLPKYGLTPGDWYFAYDDPLLEDAEREMRIIEAKIRSGIYSRNEGRADLNLSGVQGGDVYFLNGVPLGADGKPEQASPAPTFPFTLSADRAIKQLPEPASEGEIGGDDGMDRRGSADVDLGSVHLDGGPDVFGTGGEVRLLGAQDGRRVDDADGGHLGRCDDDAGEQCAVRLADHHAGPDPYADCPACGRVTKAGEQGLVVPAELISPAMAAAQTSALQMAAGTLQSIIADFLADAKADAIAQIRSASALGETAVIDLTLLQDQLAGELEDTFRELYRSGFDMAGLELGEGTDIDPFAIPNAEAVAEMQTSLVRQFSQDIGDHAAQSIEASVRAGIEEGSSIDEITKAIQDDTSFEEYRAERIARTEVSRAANEGKRQRYKEAGITKVYWVTAPGASAVHRQIEAMYPDGQDIDKPFLRAGQVVVGADGSREEYDRDIYAPPARPNCRCSLQTRKNDRPSGDAEALPENTGGA